MGPYGIGRGDQMGRRIAIRPSVSESVLPYRFSHRVKQKKKVVTGWRVAVRGGRTKIDAQMAGLGQLLQRFSAEPEGSDSDDGSYTGGTGSESDTGSSDESSQESKVSEFTGPAAEATGRVETDLDDAVSAEDDAKGAERIAADAERIAAESSPEPEPAPEPEKPPAPKKARAPANPADPDAGLSDAAICAYLRRWHPSQQKKLTNRLQLVLKRLEEPGSGVKAAAQDGFFDLPERSTDTGPKHALLVDGKVVSVFKKGAFGKFDFKACQEPSDDFTELALSTFGKKKRKAAAAGPPAKKAPAAAGAAGSAGPAKSRPIDAIFGKPDTGAGKPEPAVVDAATETETEPEPKSHGPEPAAVPAPLALSEQKEPAAADVTEVPASIYFAEGSPELVPRHGDDGTLVGFDSVRRTRKAGAGRFMPPPALSRPGAPRCKRPVDPLPRRTRRCSLTRGPPRSWSTTRCCGCSPSTQRPRSSTLSLGPPPATRSCPGTSQSTS
jgi:hypothetical protein